MLMSNSLKNRNQSGVTLIELVITIVVISIAAATLLQALGKQTIRNVDPFIQTQAQLLAQQYLNEVKSKPFFDPSSDPRIDPLLSKAQISKGLLDKSRRGEPNRMAWDNIYEYDGYRQSGIVNLDGSANPALSAFSIHIDVDMSSAVSLLDLSNSTHVNCPPRLALISILVIDPRGNNTVLSGYRASHWQPPVDWGC